MRSAGLRALPVTLPVGSVEEQAHDSRFRSALAIRFCALTWATPAGREKGSGSTATRPQEEQERYLMTAAQLGHLAEANRDAAAYVARTNPALARTFAHAAKGAQLLADQIARDDRLSTLRAELAEIKTVIA